MLERAFFDIRVFDPVAPSHINLDLEKAHQKQEKEKWRCYEERILHVEHGSFSPLVFTIAGGIGKAAQKVYSRLADFIAERRGQPKSVVVAWMWSCLSFSLLGSAILCLRGTRQSRSSSHIGVEGTDIWSVVTQGGKYLLRMKNNHNSTVG